MIWGIIGITILLILSVVVNIFLISYIRRNIVRVFVISETSSEIFTRLDSFKEHLKSIYELPLFYGDETLKSLLEHVNSLSEYLLMYEDIHSFTQPDLIEQLEAASLEFEEKYDKEVAQKEE